MSSSLHEFEQRLDKHLVKTSQVVQSTLKWVTINHPVINRTRIKIAVILLTISQHLPPFCQLRVRISSAFHQREAKMIRSSPKKEEHETQPSIKKIRSQKFKRLVYPSIFLNYKMQSSSSEL